MTRFLQIVEDTNSFLVKHPVYGAGVSEELPNGDQKDTYLGGKVVLYFNERGEFHRKDGPAVVNKSSDYEAWYLDGKRHRDGGPAYTDKEVIEWYNHGNLHRVGGPAYMSKYGDYEAWYLHGKKHRTDGPAVIDEVCGDEYWVNGKLMGRSEFNRHFSHV